MIDIESGNGSQVLDNKQLEWNDQGYGVSDVDGGDCLVSVNSGTLDASDTLSVAAGSILSGGSVQSVSQTNVQINSVPSTAGNTNTRFDTIWVDSSGTVQKTEGVAVQLTDREMVQGVVDFDVVTPVMPVPSTTPATVVGVVVVSEDDSVIDSGNLQDRRLSSDIIREDGVFESVNTDSVNNIYFAENYPGGDGGAKIQSAIDAADAAPGNNIVIVGPDGPDLNDRWDVSTPIDPPSGTHLKFVGNPLLYLPNGTNNDIIQTALDAGGSTTTDLVIEGPVEFDGNKANQSSSSPGGGLIGNVGIRLVDVDNVVVRDIEAHDFFDGYGIEVKLSTNVRIERPYVHDNGDDGISISDTDFGGVSTTRNIVVTAGRSHNNANSGYEVDDGPEGVLFDGCYSESNAQGFTINHHVGEQHPRKVRFVDCQSVNNPIGAQIKTRGTDSSAYPHGHRLEGLTVEGSTTYGVELEATGRLHGIELVDCDLELASGDGFYLEGALTDVRVSGGHVRGVVATQGGCRVIASDGDAENVVISGLTAEECGFAGVYLQSTGPDLLDCKVQNCTLRNNGQDTGAGSSPRSGIYMSVTGSITNLICTGNRCYDDQGTKTQVNGIYRSGEDWGIYSSNNLRGNASAGFAGSAGVNSLTTDNLT